MSAARPIALLLFIVAAHGMPLRCGLARYGVSTRAIMASRHAPARCAFFEGMPSTPGWEGTTLNKLTDWAKADTTNRPIICEYKPDTLWLWSKYRGTVLSITIVPVLANMAVGVATDVAVHLTAPSTWPLLAVPPASDPLIQQLSGLTQLWEYQFTLCTFILTFFTSQAYAHWKSVYFTTRAIQGRINDICLLVTVGAKRGSSSSKGYTGYSKEAERTVKLCTRFVRLSHTFFWAATPTCSNGMGDGGEVDEEGLRRKDVYDVGPLLLSPQGLDSLVQDGQLTAEERQSLLDSGLPPSQYAYLLLEWAALHAMEGMESGALRGGNGFEENLLRQVTSLRAEYFSIGDFQAGRMPLAYVQLVQVVVDSLVILAPFSLYSQTGTLSIPLVGLLTLFFKGLLELSKSFLDPFGNEGYPGQNIRVDVLVSELNFGAANRWVRAGQVLPDEPEDIVVRVR